MQQQQPPQSPEEDSLELKTPTQEDLDHMPPSSSSDGSSSGYGSQNMVCDAAAGYTDGECLLSVHSVLELFSSYFLTSNCVVLFPFPSPIMLLFVLPGQHRRAHIEICSLLHTNKASNEPTPRYSTVHRSLECSVVTFIITSQHVILAYREPKF